MTPKVRKCVILLFVCIPAVWIITLLTHPPSTVGPLTGGNRFNDSRKVFTLVRRDSNISSTNNSHAGIVMHQNHSDAPCYKVVYTWLDERDSFHFKLMFKTVGHLGQHSCPGLPCGVQIEHGRNYDRLAASDVVFLFYKSDWDWHELTKHRSERQKLVFWTSESPRHTNRRVIPPKEYTNTTYDYIMTYRTGAINKEAVLFEGGYGHFDTSRPSVPANDSRNWAAGKTKMVAWVATNCYPNTLSWDRTGFVNALARHVTVDKFGPCGKMTCKDLANCGLQQYKFYLALENSECADYITEKFWYTSLTLGLVPIVFGAPKKDYLKVAPPNSFIFVPDFPSISKLAEYLVELSQNDNMYNKYFEWKKLGFVTYRIQFQNLEPNNLCESVVRRVLKDEEVERNQKEKTGRKPLAEDWEGWWANSCNSTCSKFPIPEE